jgi:sugar/nucleoside kinase (ribokinase family)
VHWHQRARRVFHVESKAAAKGYFIVNGGCAANAAITVARLGGRAALAGPTGSDANGDFVLARERRLQGLSARSRIIHGTVGDLHRCARWPHHRHLP